MFWSDETKGVQLCYEKFISFMIKWENKFFAKFSLINKTIFWVPNCSDQPANSTVCGMTLHTVARKILHSLLHSPKLTPEMYGFTFQWKLSKSLSTCSFKWLYFMAMLVTFSFVAPKYIDIFLPIREFLHVSHSIMYVTVQQEKGPPAAGFSPAPRVLRFT